MTRGRWRRQVSTARGGFTAAWHGASSAPKAARTPSVPCPRPTPSQAPLTAASPRSPTQPSSPRSPAAGVEGRGGERRGGEGRGGGGEGRGGGGEGRRDGIGGRKTGADSNCKVRRRAQRREPFPVFRGRCRPRLADGGRIHQARRAARRCMGPAPNTLRDDTARPTLQTVMHLPYESYSSSRPQQVLSTMPEQMGIWGAWHGQGGERRQRGQPG